jgi:hypothetical protein
VLPNKFFNVTETSKHIRGHGHPALFYAVASMLQLSVNPRNSQPNSFVIVIFTIANNVYIVYNSSMSPTTRSIRQQNSRHTFELPRHWGTSSKAKQSGAYDSAPAHTASRRFGGKTQKWREKWKLCTKSVSLLFDFRIPLSISAELMTDSMLMTNQFIEPPFKLTGS